MAAVKLLEQHADAALARVSILDQSTVVSGGTSASVRLFEQHADAGGGNQAQARIIEQRATYQGGVNPPAGIAHADATHVWTPYTPFTASDTGTWV